MPWRPRLAVSSSLPTSSGLRKFFCRSCALAVSPMLLFDILFTFRRLATICRRLKNPCATAGNIAGLFTKCTYCKEYDRAFLDDPFVRRLCDQRQKRLGPRSLG